MSKNIVFISGWGVPRLIAKSRFGWNDELWTDYSRIYLPSVAPKSDVMVRQHLGYLENLINSLNNPIVMGQSLGGWWAANLACQPNIKMDKVVLYTPFSDLHEYAFFNASPLYYPYNREAKVKGPHRVLICHAREDIFAGERIHTYRLMNTFNAVDYQLDGGHFKQKNRIPCLEFIKDWMEI